MFSKIQRLVLKREKFLGQSKFFFSCENLTLWYAWKMKFYLSWWDLLLSQHHPFLGGAFSLLSLLSSNIPPLHSITTTTLLSPQPAWRRHPSWTPLPTPQEIILIILKCVRGPGWAFTLGPPVTSNLSPAALHGHWGQLSIAVCVERKAWMPWYLRLLVVILRWCMLGLNLNVYPKWHAQKLRILFIICYWFFFLDRFSGKWRIISHYC